MGERHVKTYDEPQDGASCQICGMDKMPSPCTSWILGLWLCREHEDEFMAWVRGQMAGKRYWQIWQSMPENPRNRKRKAGGDG